MAEPVAVKYSESPEYASMYRESVENPGQFWAGLARSRLTWMEDFQEAMDCVMEEGKMNWFLGGKLNVSVNCLDRHDASKVAIIWEKEEPGNHEVITYGELLRWTCQIANVLKRHGVGKGMCVAICVPTHPVAQASMMACARIGAVHCAINFESGSEGIVQMINIAQAHTVITGVFEGRERSAAVLLDALQGCPTVEHVIVAGTSGSVGEHCIALNQAIAQESTECAPEPMDSMDPLCIIFTSGTTDISKPIMHTHAGYLLATSAIFKYVFEFHPDDIFGCVMNLGWIGFHTCTVYGPLCTGGTTLLFSGTFTYPDPGRFWQMVERFKITHFFPFINHLKKLEKLGNGFVEKYDRSSLRMITAGIDRTLARIQKLLRTLLPGCMGAYSAGTLVSESTWEWYCQVVGGSSARVVQTWGQTECLGILWSEWAPSDQMQRKPFLFHSLRPFFGVELAILESDEDETTICEISQSDVQKPGLLCFKKPFPGLAKGLYGDVQHARFVEKKFKRFPGYYFTEDVAHYNEDGSCSVEGREVDIINCHGERSVSRLEIGNTLESDSRVSAAAVVGYPSTTGIGAGVCAFVVLVPDVGIDDEDGLRESLKRRVESAVGSVAVPDIILFIEALPMSALNKLVYWVLEVVASFFGQRLEHHQKHHSNVPKTCTVPGAPTPMAVSAPGSLAAVMTPVLGEQDALRLEEKLSRCDIAGAVLNHEQFYKIFEDIKALLCYN